MTAVPDEIGQANAPLQDRVIQALRAFPHQKAAELAHWLRAEPSEVLRCLSGLQGIVVQQDATYRWSLLDLDELSQRTDSTPRSRTEIARLCQYFLDCLGQDSDAGVSVPRTSSNADDEYAELAAHPSFGGQEGWWTEPAAKRLLSTLRYDKRTMEVWVGYPVRLRKQRTAAGETFMVEPLLLWRVVNSSTGGDGFALEEGLPQINFSFLRSIAMGGAAEVVEEAASLGAQLGLNNLPNDQPTPEELIFRMFSLHPEWDWVEPPEPAECSKDGPLSGLSEAGIYNRAVVVRSKRSPYTLGLESELKVMSQTAAIDFLGTSLDQWFNSGLDSGYVGPAESATQPLIEVVPMNSEQRQAVQSALVAPLTVVTGPPGTGKSQVVTNLLINAAWRGMKVLFASKNNKAVDVVESRVNGLGPRPVLLRLGSSEYQNKLSNYFSSMLSGQVGPEDLQSYRERLDRHNQLLQHAQMLDDLQLKTVEARNYVDRLDSDIDNYRALFGQQRFSAVDEQLFDASAQHLYYFLEALEALNPAHASIFDKLFGFLFREAKISKLMTAFYELAPLADELGVEGLRENQEVSFAQLEAFASAVSSRLEAAESVISYKTALEALLASPPLEAIALQRKDLTQQVALNSAGLWKDWVQLLPSRMSAAQRKEVAEYASLLQALNESGNKYVSPATRQKMHSLQQNISELFTCWAVTSLSVRGKVPLDPGYFDLVVIDEAGQCDIASAVPLLYRAKRAVIIGDPMQLKHISALSKAKDLEFQERHELSKDRLTWLYSVNSLYDLAAGVATPERVVNLRDHHRSHADIIEFSNKTFYNGRLRVATRHDALLRPDDRAPGIVWTDVKGQSIRPPEGGLKNIVEAEEVVHVLKVLLLDQKFKGTVGIATPFRAQASLIQYLLSKHQDLAEASANCDLIVDTAHRFQGDERDVVIFSPVVSAHAPNSSLDFLRNNANLFNVAVTRARALLHVVGDVSATMTCGVPHLAEFSRYVQTLKGAPVLRHLAQEDLGPKYPPVPYFERVSEWEKSFYEALYAADIRAIPQFNVEHFTLDFAVIIGSRKLSIEIDADRYHRNWTAEECLRDQLRNQRLGELGWEIKRFWVYELKDRMSRCVEQVAEWAWAARVQLEQSQGVPPRA